MDLSLPQANRKTQGGSTQSSCFGPSLVVTSTTTLPSLPLSVVNHAASRALLHPQSLLPAGFWSGLTTLSSPCLSHRRLLLDIFQIPQPASYCHVNFRRPAYSFNHKREHSQAPGYHLSNRVSINSAFQNQDKRRTGQFVVRRAEKMTTAVFSVKTLKVPRAFWQQFDAPGKEKKKKKKSHPSQYGQDPFAHWAITSQPADAQAGPTGRRVPADTLCTPWHSTPSSWSSSWGGFP